MSFIENDVIKAMKDRRSIRKFKADMPEKEHLEAIVEAGLYAASGKGMQATITIAVTDKELRDRLAEINRQIGGWDEGFDPFYGAPAILIVLGDKSIPTSSLGSIWINRAKEEFEMPEYKQLLKDLGIEGEWEGIGHCAVGYMDCDLPKPADRKEGRVFWIE